MERQQTHHTACEHEIAWGVIYKAVISHTVGY